MGYQELRGEGEHRAPNLLKKIRYFVDEYVSLKENKKLIIIIVFVALFLDNMLVTTIVPIIPNYLWNQRYGSLNAAAYCQRLRVPPDNLNTTKLLDRGFIDFHEFAVQIRLEEEDAKLIPANITCDEEFNRIKHIKLGMENMRIGLMFASKPVFQLLTNPFVGPLTNRVGYSVPMFCGFVIMFVATLIFAFGTSFNILLAARAVQGIGSAFSSVSGMGMLASVFQDNAERGRAFGFALSGLALGVLVGPSFGGVMYELFDKSTPFIILAFLALLDGVLQLIVLKPKIRPEAQEGTALLTLLRDPYILIAAGSLTFGNMGIAILEPSLPIWMKDTMNAAKWEQGIAFLPASFSYLLSTAAFGVVGHKMGRWLCSCIGLLLGAFAIFIIPFSHSLLQLLLPNFFLGLSIGMVDASMLPIMGYLVDLRHVSVYGSVYAITDVAFCLGFAVGPAIGGPLVQHIGFHWLMWGMSIISFTYAPCMYFLRNPPATNEAHIKDIIISKTDQIESPGCVDSKETTPVNMDSINNQKIYQTQ